MGCAPFIGLDRFAGGLGKAGASSSVPTIALGAPGTPANRFDIDSTGLGPGDSSQRVLDINTKSARDFVVTLRISVTKSSLLDRDRVNGLQISLDDCRSGWHENHVPFVYECRGGRIGTVMSSRPLADVKWAGPIVMRLTSGSGTEHLRMRVVLPSTAKNQFQGLTTVLKLDLTATPSR